MTMKIKTIKVTLQIIILFNVAPLISMFLETASAEPNLLKAYFLGYIFNIGVMCIIFLILGLIWVFDDHDDPDRYHY